MDETKPDPKPKKPSVLLGPRFQALLQVGASVATTLAVIALAGPKKPLEMGE